MILSNSDVAQTSITGHNKFAGIPIWLITYFHLGVVFTNNADKWEMPLQSVPFREHVWAPSDRWSLPWLPPFSRSSVLMVAEGDGDVTRGGLGGTRERKGWEFLEAGREGGREEGSRQPKKGGMKMEMAWDHWPGLLNWICWMNREQQGPWANV